MSEYKLYIKDLDNFLYNKKQLRAYLRTLANRLANIEGECDNCPARPDCKKNNNMLISYQECEDILIDYAIKNPTEQ